MKPANAWSIRDMHGNVAEWCRDAVGPDRSELAIRGGSWDSDLSARAAARNSDTPFLRINRVGFRLVLVREKSPDSTPLPPVCKIITSRTP
jgi:formylglycine-generating enzyme required for sulfatase activity